MQKHLITALITWTSVAVAGSGLAQGQATNDGTYTGQVTNVETISGNVACGAGGFLKSITVKNGAFSLVYNAAHNETITGTISSDGSVSGFSRSDFGGVRLTAKIQGNGMTGQIFSATCRYTFQLTKS